MDQPNPQTGVAEGEDASGIYAITNTLNGKKYVGSAVNLANRLTFHRWELRKQRHHSIKLQRAWNKYGEDAFAFAPLLLCAKKDLIFYEQRAIDALDAAKSGYNVLAKAGSALGFRHTPETRKRMSVASKGKVMSDAMREKRRQQMLGKTQPAEVRAKISAAMRGHKKPQSVIDALHAREVSAATREKIRSALMGHGISEETRAKMRASQRRRFAKGASNVQ